MANSGGEFVTIVAEKLTRFVLSQIFWINKFLKFLTFYNFFSEDTIVVNELGATIEKGLVLHGANPAVDVGDVLVCVNGEQFSSIEDLLQV